MIRTTKYVVPSMDILGSPLLLPRILKPGHLATRHHLVCEELQHVTHQVVVVLQSTPHDVGVLSHFVALDICNEAALFTV